MLKWIAWPNKLPELMEVVQDGEYWRRVNENGVVISYPANAVLDSKLDALCWTRDHLMSRVSEINDTLSVIDYQIAALSLSISYLSSVV